jgi:hypothetical protein
MPDRRFDSTVGPDVNRNATARLIDIANELVRIRYS